MEDYVVITQETASQSHTIYDNSVTNLQTNKGTSIGRMQGDMITLYGLNQIHQNDTALKILKNLFKNYTYIVRQLDFNIDIFGLDKDRISSVYNTNTDKFHRSPREQLENNYTYLSGIGTTNIVIPDNKKHKNLIQKIKVIPIPTKI